MVMPRIRTRRRSVDAGAPPSATAAGIPAGADVTLPLVHKADRGQRRRAPADARGANLLPPPGELALPGHRPRETIDVMHSKRAHLRGYGLDPGTVFEGGLLGAVEGIQVGRGTKGLDALFVTPHQASDGLAAVDLPSGGAGGTFSSMLDFRFAAPPLVSR